MSALSAIAKYLLEKAGKATAEHAVERQVPLAVERAVAPLAVKAPLAVHRPLALPAPPRVLALPKPGPGLPAHAAKPRGGQWAQPGLAVSTPLRRNAIHPPEDIIGDLLPARRNATPAMEGNPVAEWLQRNLTKYVKNDLGSPDDPLRLLAERGVQLPGPTDHMPWSERAQHVIHSVDFGKLVGPDAVDEGQKGALLAAHPWMAKQPVTDPMHGVIPMMNERLGFDHLTDELSNAIDPASGFPPNLAVNPQSLSRMSVPDAVQRVHDIGQWREAQMAKQQAEAMDSPAIFTHKEYPDDPRGMRWVEIKQPGANAPLPDGFMPDGKGYYNDHTGDYQSVHPALQASLKNEGDTMGHCVGGYCDDVASGRSRIFSLRDAKGQPHVTVETAPGGDPYNTPNGFGNRLNELQPGVWPQVSGHPDFYALGGHETVKQHFPELWGKLTSTRDSIVQIKGKQNRAPNEDYLPYVQDFVKSQPWGRVGDLGNTGLVPLPDGRYVTNQQWDQGVRAKIAHMNPDLNPDMMDYHAHTTMPMSPLVKDRWEDFAPHFEGFAYGGRVEQHRDFAYHPLTVRRAA